MEGESIGLERGSVVIREYDPRWATEFEREQLVLAQLLGDLDARIEHIGSTAVEGLAAKPIIDIAIGFDDRTWLEQARQLLAEVGYDDRGDFGDAGGVVFAKGSEERRTHYLHLVQVGSDQWHRYLAFRDALRGDPGRREEYAKLKRTLAMRVGNDREAYLAGKAAFIETAVSDNTTEA